MQNLQVHYTYKTKNATVQDLCIVQSKTKRFTKTQQLNTQLKLATQLNLKHFYAVTLTHYSVIQENNMPQFGFTVINYNTLLIVNCTTQEQRYANNVTLPSLYAVTQKQLAKLFKTAR